MYLGIKIILAKSFSRIHKSNLINYGIIPLTFKNINDYNYIKSNDHLNFLNIKKEIKENKNINAFNETKNQSYIFTYKLSSREQNIIFAVLNVAINKKI